MKTCKTCGQEVETQFAPGTLVRTKTPMQLVGVVVSDAVNALLTKKYGLDRGDVRYIALHNGASYSINPSKLEVLKGYSVKS